MRLKDAVLLGGRKAGIQWQNIRLAAWQMTAAELVRSFQDVPLGRQKDEHIATAQSADFLDRVGDAANRVDRVLAFLLNERPVEHIHRIHPSGDFDNRSGMVGITLRVTPFLTRSVTTTKVW